MADKIDEGLAVAAALAIDQKVRQAGRLCVNAGDVVAGLHRFAR